MKVLCDVSLWAVLSALIAWDLIVAPADPHAGWRLAGSLLLMALAVGVGRRHPPVSLLIVVASTAFEDNFVFAVPVMSYLVGLRMSRARPAAYTFALIAVAGTALTVGVRGAGVTTWFFLTTALLFAGVFPWLVGRHRRQQRALVQAGWERAGLLERQQRAAAERVRMQERARIAQDMHDSLGHDLSLIALKAGGLEVAADLDERHRRAVGELRASVTAATDQLAQIIGVLREDGAPAPTRPAAEGVADLVERARDAGMSVRLRSDGSPAPAPPMVERAVYRVVQEALTNATRHAPRAAVTVLLTRSAEQTVVSVVNGPPPAGPLPGVTSTGSGLVGLRERVRLAGGALSAGPRDGGFEVTARLPHAAGAASAEADEGVRTATPESATRLREARRRVRRSLLVAVAAPVVVAGVLSLVYYPFATFDAVLEPADFDRMRIGQHRTELRGLLPERQVVERPDPADWPLPPGASCEFYTDGNFPLGQAAYRLCFVEGRLLTKDRMSD
ncbi:Signal transduction histidine kinase [Micromonospora citrea]|uniref:histidine kinase n=1 Tax=Micromonospora citrea TaxID=47855 RepID=A0A1C6TQU0_9ACTN|nr:Signal transduction histidine kinase [Micromonospora citrea]